MSDPLSASASDQFSAGHEAASHSGTLPSHNEGTAPRHVPDTESHDEDTFEPGERSGGLLTLVATPIGNLGDLSTRAIRAMQSADLVLCEDTRVTARLFTEHNITTRAEPLHEHNERQRVPGLIRRLEAGQHIALASDAGMPLLSDPGYRLTREAIACGIPVTAVPGPNAALTALVLSGLPPHPFMFVGFPPPRSAARRESFSTLHAAERAGLRTVIIWHEAPHRLGAMLDDLVAVFGEDREAAVARELTKRFEEVRRGTLKELRDLYIGTPPRGEITVLIGPAGEEETSGEDLDRQLTDALQSHSVKDAATLVATAAGLPRKVVYARALELNAARKEH